jgi:hypothetical protein
MEKNIDQKYIKEIERYNKHMDEIKRGTIQSTDVAIEAWDFTLQHEGYEIKGIIEEWHEAFLIEEDWIFSYAIETISKNNEIISLDTWSGMEESEAIQPSRGWATRKETERAIIKASKVLL